VYVHRDLIQGCAFCPKACQQYFAYRINFNCTYKKESQIFLMYKEIQHRVIYEEGLPYICGNALIFTHIRGIRGGR
jgi:hypothetical protein